jgi:hypothetical protein
MTKRIVGAVVLAACLVMTATSQGPDDKKDKGPGKKGPPPKGFKLGKLLPPHIMRELELTDDQRDKLRALEKETRQKLEKILTKKQIEQIEQMGPPRRPRPEDDDDRPPPEGKGKGKGKGKRPPKEDDDDRPPPPKGKRPPPKEDNGF